MGGKKKKSLANKLAKMSDEERARYLQHRAEVEEEAKRRKEQLIATFMKKKIKKEEAFSRLNMAKINQNWHQILRKIKVKEMKDEVEHLKRSIERVLEYKNRRIAKLMDELDEAEEQYLNNFNSHSIYLDCIIENQHDYIENLQTQYKKDLDDLFEQAKKEENSIRDNANSEINYLKTIIYGQENQAVKELRESWERYSKQLYEVEYNDRTKLKHLRKTSGEAEAALWKQILQLVLVYVQRIDTRRSHLQELRRMDAESAEEIQGNEERIIKEEELIKILNANHEDLLKLKTDKFKSLQAEENALNKKFLKIRKDLKIHLNLDEAQLRLLTVISNETLDELHLIKEKGKHILSLSETCRKFETERERISKWLPVMTFAEVSEEIKASEGAFGLTDEEKLTQKEFSLRKLDTSETKLDIKIETKKLKEAKSPEKAATNFLDKCYENLEKLENFWMIYNKCEIDIMELKQEKSKLEKENKQLRGFIRAVLEAAVLSKSIQNSTVPTRVQSKRRSAYSAPLHRITF